MENLGLIPTHDCVQRICEAFPEGCEVELIWMDDVYHKIPRGTRGKVARVDAIGTIFVHWENGSGLGVVWNSDIVRNVQTGVVSNTLWDDGNPPKNL